MRLMDRKHNHQKIFFKNLSKWIFLFICFFFLQNEESFAVTKCPPGIICTPMNTHSCCQLASLPGADCDMNFSPDPINQGDSTRVEVWFWGTWVTTKFIKCTLWDNSIIKGIDFSRDPVSNNYVYTFNDVQGDIECEAGKITHGPSQTGPTLCSDSISPEPASTCVNPNFNPSTSGFFDMSGNPISQYPSPANSDFQVRCDFGLSSSGDIHASGCTYSNWSGTAVIFTCKSPASGTFSTTCSIGTNNVPPYQTSCSAASQTLTLGGNTPYCGDYVCNGTDTCTNCDQDCGQCETNCPNNYCEPDEDCSTCPQDCSCAAGYCGDGICDFSYPLYEDCAACPQDCSAGCSNTCVQPFFNTNTSGFYDMANNRITEYTPGVPFKVRCDFGAHPQHVSLTNLHAWYHPTDGDTSTIPFATTLHLNGNVYGTAYEYNVPYQNSGELYIGCFILGYNDYVCQTRSGDLRINSGAPVCGDGTCDIPGGETCSSCPAECGACTCTFTPPRSIPWTDPVIKNGSEPNPTMIKQVHFTELQNEIDILRADAGLVPPFNWTKCGFKSGPNNYISRKNIICLRRAIQDVYEKCGQSLDSWTDPKITINTPIREVHIRELRKAVKNAK